MAKSTPRRVDLTQTVPVRIRAIFNGGKGVLMNVSSTGAYVATSMYLLLQGRVRLQIVLRDERRWVEVEGVVVWENRGTLERREALPPGYGVRFLAVPRDTAEVIDKLLSADGRDATPQSQSVDASTGIESLVEERPDAIGSSFDSEPDAPPYRLRNDGLERHAPKNEPGVFVLSYDRTQEARVGRADTSLRETLASFEGQYAYFYCETIEVSDERYTRECELFHRLGGDRGQLDNTDHPKAPDGTAIDCPICVHERV